MIYGLIVMKFLIKLQDFAAAGVSAGGERLPAHQCKNKADVDTLCQVAGTAVASSVARIATLNLSWLRCKTCFHSIKLLPAKTVWEIVDKYLQDQRKLRKKNLSKLGCVPKQ